MSGEPNLTRIGGLEIRSRFQSENLKEEAICDVEAYVGR
jgi:hypothetical protein